VDNRFHCYFAGRTKVSRSILRWNPSRPPRPGQIHTRLLPAVTHGHRMAGHLELTSDGGNDLAATRPAAFEPAGLAHVSWGRSRPDSSIHIAPILLTHDQGRSLNGSPWLPRQRNPDLSRRLSPIGGVCTTRPPGARHGPLWPNCCRVADFPSALSCTTHTFLTRGRGRNASRRSCLTQT